MLFCAKQYKATCKKNIQYRHKKSMISDIFVSLKTLSEKFSGTKSW